MHRKLNFSSGPAAIPLPVLERAQQDMLNWNNQGASVMELSHRSKPVVAMAEKARDAFRRLLNVPDTHDVLFLGCGARHLFSWIPQNILGDRISANYVVTGQWSNGAAQDAARFTDVVTVTNNEENRITVAPQSDWAIDERGAYLYYCDNETVHGIEFNDVPQIEGMPLVCDMSSNMMSRPVDVSQFGVVFACAQKNLGPSGISVIVVDKSLYGRASSDLPDVQNFAKQAAKDCMLNSPPVFAWYMVGLMMDWIDEQGGLSAVNDRNQQKAQKLYEFIDGSDFYYNNIDTSFRSRMNVVFDLQDTSRDAAFLAAADEAGIIGLKGHRNRGGMRAGIYNAASLEMVEQLIDFMREFERANA